MRIARKTYLVVAALFVALVATAPLNAQGDEGDEEGEVVCWWCMELNDGSHTFGYGEQGCNSDLVGPDDDNVYCSRCGRTSDCHPGRYDPGPCHIACGPAGEAETMAALTEIQEALDGDDVEAVALALGSQRVGVSVEFIPAAGRIDLVRRCDPTRAVRTIPVFPEMRAELEAELRTAAMPRP